MALPLRVFSISSLLLFISFGVFAQSGISVNNGKLFFNSLEGQKQTRELIIANPNNEEITLQTDLFDWKRDSFGIKNYAKPSSLPASCSSWISLEPANITIPGGGKTTVKVILDIPRDYNPDSGVRNSMLFLRQLSNPVPPKSNAGKLTSTIQMIFQIGVHVYYTHPSLTYKELVINNLDFDKTEKKILLELENKGETLLEGFMQFEFTNMETGEEIKLFERSIAANFMPGDVRRFDFKIPQNITPGKYSVTSIIDIGADQDLLLGVLEINY